jgi:transcriptional regulator with XRE-family HTH domain
MSSEVSQLIADGLRLRREREAHGLTRPQLAGLCGVPTTDIKRIERGRASTCRASLVKVEAFLAQLPDGPPRTEGEKDG